jgi:hypothetical protein
MMRLLDRLLGRKAEYHCYWLALHFTSAEQAAQWVNDYKRAPNFLQDDQPDLADLYIPAMPRITRLLRSGERVPLCRQDGEAALSLGQLSQKLEESV